MARDKPRIVCLDLDTFFVSVERLLDPSLEGKPVIVGGRPGSRGVVTACSYEVRRLGVRSGMSLTRASQLAPNAIYLSTRHDTYVPYAARVREVAEHWCPIVQVASIDEMYMDFAGCEALYRKPEDASDDETIRRVVREITATIKRDIGLPSSAGIATSRSMSKVACGLAKPAGVLLVPRGAERDTLAPLPVRKLPGIGPVAEEALAKVGIRTLGEVAATPLERLRKVFGAWAEHVKKSSVGEGSGDLGRDRPAFSEHDPEGEIIGSISNERTFHEDVRRPEIIDAMLCSLTERVCWRARKRGIKGRTVTLKLRYANFHTISRSRTFSPTHSELELYPVVRQIYEEARDPHRPIRLLGLQLSNLGFFDEQINLFQDGERLHSTVDKIRERFGFDAVRLAESTRTKRRTRSD
ncbi:MAG: DNA polymerase IV [Deltaproteobacteria bacterium]|jgi:DNA polymerase-4